MRTHIFWVIIVTLIVTFTWLMLLPKHAESPVACTMEARICPDGSAVGRIGPNCEFAACPPVSKAEDELSQPPVPDVSTVTDSEQPILIGDNVLPPPEYEAPYNGAVACTMDAKMCADGSYVGRVAPNCNFAPCPGEENIRVEAPREGSAITSPVTIQGTARGNWFFEASFPISIVNWDGLIIGEGIATAQDDWMTEDFVPFTATISYTLDPQTPYNRGAIILKKDNPSGLPEHDASLEIPVTLSELPETVILSQ